jgi:hypothetical protein
MRGHLERNTSEGLSEGLEGGYIIDSNISMLRRRY